MKDRNFKRNECLMNPITLTVPILKFEYDLWSYYLAIPKNIGDSLIKEGNRRVLCSVNGKDKTHSALMPKGEVYSIYLKKDFMKKNGLSEGDQVQVTLEPDDSAYGMDIPESFQTLLEQDIEGSSLFHGLTKGKQRTLLHLIGKVKNIDSQLAKGLAIMHHLKESDGHLDFKQLNEVIKAFNNRHKHI